MKTIALFGGSFDPPHLGHYSIVHALLEIKEIDEIIVMPTYLNPFKDASFAPAELRLRWLKEIFKEERKVTVSDFEIQEEKKVPTITTVENLSKNCDKIYLIIGADNLKDLHSWYRYSELEKLVTFMVAHRESISIPPCYADLQVEVNISSSEIRKKIQEEMLCRVNAKEIVQYYKKQLRTTMKERIKKITNVLDTNKAEDIEVFDLHEKNYFVEYAIIASSLGSRHTLALLDHLKKGIKPEETFNNVDESGDWVVIDLGDLLIHIMTAEYRAKYDMETFLSELGQSTGEEW